MKAFMSRPDNLVYPSEYELDELVASAPDVQRDALAEAEMILEHTEAGHKTIEQALATGRVGEAGHARLDQIRQTPWERALAEALSRAISSGALDAPAPAAQIPD